ncbi:hypothetical protein MCOR14_009984 [Pyricularia oryzae]|nr:hypothetical protein MCOR13_010062 [Pyricularia oryzae]KAI6621658.1 hypothetical protein MCOR14_009984 [Pyricularia oryzae]
MPRAWLYGGAGPSGTASSPMGFVYQCKEGGIRYPWFANWVSGQKCEDDPQPGPVPEEWWKIEWNSIPDDPACFIRFENTGEVINSDPRLDSARCQLGDAGTGGKAGVWVVQSTVSP